MCVVSLDVCWCLLQYGFLSLYVCVSVLLLCLPNETDKWLLSALGLMVMRHITVNRQYIKKNYTHNALKMLQPFQRHSRNENFLFTYCKQKWKRKKGWPSFGQLPANYTPVHISDISFSDFDLVFWNEMIAFCCNVISLNGLNVISFMAKTNTIWEHELAKTGTKHQMFNNSNRICLLIT